MCLIIQFFLRLDASAEVPLRIRRSQVILVDGKRCFRGICRFIQKRDVEWKGPACRMYGYKPVIRLRFEAIPGRWLSGTQFQSGHAVSLNS